RFCGDGVVDVDHGEVCDQVLPAGLDCMSLGADLGALACTSSCAPALDRCHRFGWVRAHAVQEPVAALWGGGGRIGVIYQSGATWLVGAGGPAQAPGSYAAIGGTPTTVWAASPTTIARWAAATGWTPEPAPWPATASVVGVWASDTLGL